LPFNPDKLLSYRPAQADFAEPPPLPLHLTPATHDACLQAGQPADLCFERVRLGDNPDAIASC
jgi:hypothetical protein